MAAIEVQVVTERVIDVRGMPRCPNGYHRSPDGDCEYVG